MYFIDNNRQQRLAVPSIRLFEYDRKDDSVDVSREVGREKRYSYVEANSAIYETRNSLKKTPSRVREEKYATVDH